MATRRELRDTRESPRDAMADAIAEANATRPRTSHTHKLADAKRDHDVAMVSARDAYARALNIAEGNYGRAEMSATKRYWSAREWARTDAAKRRANWERTVTLVNVEQIVQLYSYVGLLISDVYAPRADRSKRAGHVSQHRMLADMLRRRRGNPYPCKVPGCAHGHARVVSLSDSDRGDRAMISQAELEAQQLTRSLAVQLERIRRNYYHGGERHSARDNRLFVRRLLAEQQPVYSAVLDLVVAVFERRTQDEHDRAHD